MPGTQNSPSLRIKAARQKAPWTILFLFCFLSGLPAQENFVPTEHATELKEQQFAADSGQLEEINSRIAELESELSAQKDISELKAIYTYDKRNIDLGYQSLFVYLAILTIAVAVAAFLVPYWFTRKAREVADRAAKDTERARDAAEEARERISGVLKQSEELLGKIKEYKIQAEKLARIPTDEPLDKEGKQTVEDVLKDPRSSDREKLLASALLAQNNKKWDEAVVYWKLLISLDSKNSLYYFGLGNTLFQFGQLKITPETAERYKMAIKNFEIAASLKSNYHQVYNNWGIALKRLAELKNDAGLYEQAIEKYTEAVRIKPDKYEAYNNWGNALSDLAEQKGDEGLFRESFEKYAEAVRINPKYHEAYNNWGNALSDLAKLRRDKGLFGEAFEKYAEAIRIKSDFHIAYNNWGDALSDLAKLKNDEGLFLESFDKFAEAVRIKKNFHEAYNNWGNALLRLARLNKDDKLYQEASEKLLKAEEIKEGSGSYNLACIASLTNKSEECSTWLEKARKAETLPSLQILKEDSDLDNVREEVWFKKLLRELEERK